MYLIFFFAERKDDDRFYLMKDKEHVSDSSKETLCFVDDCSIACFDLSEHRMFILLSGCLIFI